MRRQASRTIIRVMPILALLVGTVFWVGTSQATPGSGAAAELLGAGNLPEPVRVKIKADSTKHIDVSQIQTYKITLAPDGYTGWHQHGGPHLIVVASGTLTYYEGDDPTCTGVNYPAGSSIMDPGFTTHFARNEGTVEVVTYVTQLLPAGGTFRIDVPAPGYCSF